MSTTQVDEARLEELMGGLVGFMTGGALCSAIWLGDELGLYRAMEGSGPLSADEVAKRTACHPRLVREWLDGQAAGGLVTYDPSADTYALSAEQALALADDEAPVFVARAMNALGSFFIDLPKVAAAYKGDGGLPWGDHHQCLFDGTAWFFRTGYRAELPTSWIPALEGVEAKLEAGASAADVGCGCGASSAVIAQAYPVARIDGFDYHEPSIETARKRAAEAGVTDRATFVAASATSYEGAYDLI